MSLKMGHATTVELLPNDTRTANVNGSGIDISDYVGDVMITIHSDVGGGTNPTLAGKIQDSATTGGTFADISGATFTSIDNTAGGSLQTLIIKANATKLAIRFVGIVGGTSPTFGYGVSITGFKQVR